MLTSTTILFLSLFAAAALTALAGERPEARAVESCARCGGETGKRGCQACGWPYR